MTPRIGGLAPDFILRDQHGRPRSLGELRGERVVLVVFFPYAFSSVCAGELGELRDRHARLADAGAEVLAVSCDPMFTLRAFADRDGLEFPLLSDFWPHGEVARAYDAFDDQHGCSTRATFLVDRDGLLVWSVRSPMGEARDPDEYLVALSRVGADRDAGK